MILVLTGTGDGRKITQALIHNGYSVSVIASTSYGRELALEDGAGLLDDVISLETTQWLSEMCIQAIIDARHPFARKEEQHLYTTCQQKGILYLQVGREETKIVSNELLHPVHSMKEAAEKASSLGKTIFLTTGSHDLEHFINLQKQYGFRLVVRVLPEHRVIKKCQELGMEPKDIIAMQGPFSKQINKALFKMYKASVVVTKDSGKAGGTDTKVDAALSLKIPVVIIKRQTILKAPEYPWEQIVSILTERLI